MKLKSLKPVDFPSSGRGMTAKPFVRFSTKGVITFNKAAVKLLNLSDKENIFLTQDEDKPDDFYLCKSQEGFAVKVNEKGGQFNNSNLSNHILNFFNLNDGIKTGFRFNIGEGVEYGSTIMYPLITRPARQISE